MTDQIMQKLNEMQALTCSSPVPLGVSVARHTDRLLAETRRELRTCIDALRAVQEKLGIDDYCEACVHVDCETSRTIAEALGVES